MSVDFSKPGLKPCIICKMLLEDIIYLECGQKSPWASMQPYYGGEVRFMFSYGSTKYDPATFKGVICYDCAESLMERLQEC